GHLVVTIPIRIPGGSIGWIPVKASFDKSVHRNAPDPRQLAAKLDAQINVRRTFVNADVLGVRPDLGIGQESGIRVIPVIGIEILPSIDPTAFTPTIGV